MTEFEQVYRENYPTVYRYVLSLCRNGPLAEEIAQEAFVKAMEHIDGFDGRCRLYVWLCRIARNTYFTHQKKQKRYASDEFVPPQWAAGPEEEMIDRDTARRICALLDAMNEPYREVFSLRVFGELSFSQIGAIYGKTDSWARLIYFRAKKKLKEDLDEQDTL